MSSGPAPPSARERILQAAIDLVGDRGSYDGLTVTAVADRAGVSRQTVYASVGDLHAVLGFAMQRVSAEAIAELRAAVDEDLGTAEYVADMLVRARGLFLRHPLLSLLFRPTPENPVFGAPMMEHAHPFVAAQLADRRARDPRLEQAAPFRSFVELVIRLGLSVLLHPSEGLRSDADLRAFVVQWVEGGLARAALDTQPHCVLTEPT